MSELVTAALVAVSAFALAMLTNLLLASLGEPQALWLWRDVLGVL